jgi:uncharacterized protein with HEPN domain
MNLEFLDYLEDILDAMEKAEIMLENVDYARFEADFRVNFAVIRALEIIGEATKRIPDQVRNQYDEIPWKGMAGMRDRIIHGYDQVDLETVWDVVKRDIPRIRPFIKQIIQEYGA